MHVLFVGFVWPEPRSSAAGQNILSYVKACLSANWRVSFCSGADTTTQSYDLESISVNTFNASLNCSSFDEQVGKLQPDLVIFDRFLSFEQFAWRVKKSCPSSALVIDAEDLHCLRNARHILNTQQKNPAQFMQSDDIALPQYRGLLNNEITRREIACILQADLTIVLSSYEFQLLRDVFSIPERQITHIPFILDNKALALKTGGKYESKNDFIFMGNYRHAPNYHALKVLREQCWPAIFKRLKPQYPEVTCHIYGAYSTSKVHALASKKLHFQIHGFAPDQFDVISNARVMLAPITFGAGVKGKLLDAMICDTPSITTNIGSEGITALAWPGAIVDDVDAFIDKACQHYDEKDVWHEAVTNAKTILSTDYNIDKNTLKFQESMQEARDKVEENRAQNLLQQILDERHYQANKYMSQWIEAKNR